MKKEVRKDFNELKRKYPEAVLLVRIGDFYNAYQEDAQKVGEVIRTSATVDTEGDRHVFFHEHELDTILPKLIRAGNRVAIYDYK